MAQIIVAIQMVLEEKFIYKHNVHPLRAVGTEGACGHGAGRHGGRDMLRVSLWHQTHVRSKGQVLVTTGGGGRLPHLLPQVGVEGPLTPTVLG